MTNGNRGLKSKTLAKALSNAGNHGVVVDDVRVDDVSHGSKARIETIQTAIDQVAGESIVISADDAAGGVRSTVVEADDELLRQFTLDAHQIVPSLRRAQVRVNTPDTALNARKPAPRIKAGAGDLR